MEYWKSEPESSGDAGTFRDYRPRSRTAHAHPSVVASGGNCPFRESLCPSDRHSFVSLRLIMPVTPGVSG